MAFRKIILGALALAMNDTGLWKSRKIELMYHFSETLENTPTEELEKAYDKFYDKYLR